MLAPSVRQTAAFLAALAVLGACGPSDPLDEARRAQDERNDFAAPLEMLRELVDERSGDPEVQYRYGLALVASNQPTLALWPLQRAAQSPEWESRANFALASAHSLAGAHDDAIEVIDREVERDPDDPFALHLRANTRVLSRRDYEAALADADRVLELDPDYTDILPTRAVALLNLGLVDEAEEVIDEIDSLHREESLGLHGSPGLCAARAKFAEEKGELELAEERYDACLDQFPFDAGLIDMALSFHDGAGRVDRGNEILRTALDELPEARGYRIALASRLRAHGRMDEALEVLREGTEHPEPLVAAEAWAVLARFQLDAGLYDEAFEAYAEVRRLAGPDDDLLFRTADALVVAGRHDEAFEMAGEIGVPAYRDLIRGRVALARGDAEQALSHFEKGIRLWPNNAVTRYYAAVSAEQVGDFERAIEEYRYAVRIDPRATDGYLRLARLHEAAGRPELALTILDSRPGDRPNERDAALLQLRLLASLGRAGSTPAHVLQELQTPADRGAAAAALARGLDEGAGTEEAIKAIRGVENLDLSDPEQSDALAALVDALGADGQGESALAEVDGALDARPEAAVFHALRGRALVWLGRVDAARGAFERALELDVQDRTALVGLARLEAAAGASEAARALYERVLALDAGDAEAAHGMADSLVSLGSGAEAEERLEALLREHPYDTEAAMKLTELRLARGADDPRTRELARRAVYFGGGEAAQALLERVEGAAVQEDTEAPEPEVG